MTAKQILDSFSETLMRDERILSSREREFVTSLLQHAKATANANSETHAAVNAVIASALGETVAQRAFAVLGGSIVERILATGGSGTAVEDRTIYGMPLPVPPPSPGPQPPGVVKPPATPPVPPSPGPQPPGTPMPHEPGSPKHHPKHRGLVDTETTVAVLDTPEVLSAQCVVLDEFLAPQEVDELLQHALEHEAGFCTSEVISPSLEEGVIDYDHRRSSVLTDLGRHQEVIVKRIEAVLPQVLDKLGMDAFPISRVEAQITASNHGDYFRNHTDDGDIRMATRHLTFVYFFHREPRPFQGGELRIHDARWNGHHYVSTGSYQTIVPQQNQIVFFPCSLLHEITPVECSSRRFADSRFTLNGWLHR